ncbi:hypothetical protein AMAG_13990 [Allomyces macrogynus ATCC 38327]|uniref:DNA damage-binding protein CMR1 n=1 Tax=Allomyces macrogynus (strain ATCC 38327) TaxID=578462 RepID=A0A0L0T386_ALLM3|nr:hypothetical protein AMAG_13990 [Allomyces macrogynus ATCC 38327]|eukprot:KNE69135.1 hypothetical protein AMAG_13990 [Allomyces macrogynus ATCC 38327]
MSNEYERQRLENIRKNEELLKSLNIKPASKIIPTASAPTKSSSPAPKAKPATKKRKAPARSSAVAATSDADSSSTRRTSLRLRGLQPDGEQAARAALAESTSSSPAVPSRAEKRARRDTAAFSLDDAVTEGSGKAKQAGHLLRELAELVQADVKEAFDANPYAYESGDENEPDASTKAIRRVLGRLEVQHEAPVKVVPSRIYTAEFAPIETKVLACVGDKMGTLALWDLTDHVHDPHGRGTPANAAEGDDEDDKPDEDPMLRNLYTFQPHSGTISTIHFPPGLPADRLYTSSYDGTVRALDLAAQQFVAVASGADDITSMASSAALPNLLWLSTASGSAAAIDVRAGPIPVIGASVDVSSRVGLGSPFATKSFHHVFDKKCGCVSVHPTKPHLVLLSSNDTSMRLFDVRRAEFHAEAGADHAALFSQLAVPTELSDDDEEADTAPTHGLTQLASYAHGYSCTAAYFRPNDGGAIVSTSYDDRVRIWRDPLTSLTSPTFSAMHNNKTGKWVTTFRARWHTTVPDCVLVGNMKRHVDVMDAKTGKFVAMLDHASISAVPAVVAVHPAVRHQGLVLAGNASGKCHVWTRRVEEEEEEGGQEVKEEGDKDCVDADE